MQEGTALHVDSVGLVLHLAHCRKANFGARLVVRCAAVVGGGGAVVVQQ